MFQVSGFERYELEVKGATESRDRYQRRLDRATAEGNEKAVSQNRFDVERKEGDIAEAQAKLDEHLIKAPSPALSSLS